MDLTIKNNQNVGFCFCCFVYFVVSFPHSYQHKKGVLFLWGGGGLIYAPQKISKNQGGNTLIQYSSYIEKEKK